MLHSVYHTKTRIHIVKIEKKIANITLLCYTGNRKGETAVNGIDLNSPITYRYSSLRYFAEGEHHIKRYAEEDVLLLVYEGVLRFTEDGTAYEIGAGQYHIQKHDTDQDGPLPSSSPRYFYVHFSASWTDGGLPADGTFDPDTLKPLILELDRLRRDGATLTEQTAAFFRILACLLHKEKTPTAADEIEVYLCEHYREQITLALLSQTFHFSPNHIISLFKREYGVTPFEYIARLRIKRAEWLLEVTSDTVESIAYECGYANYSHFYRTFEKQNGMSPRAWRASRPL